jgi:hypothetical protein
LAGISKIDPVLVALASQLNSLAASAVSIGNSASFTAVSKGFTLLLDIIGIDRLIRRTERAQVILVMKESLRDTFFKRRRICLRDQKSWST